MKLIDLFRRAKPRPARDLKAAFVPVIFANGEDDDLPGLEAAVTGGPVQFDEKIYRTGDRLEIRGRTMAFSCGGLVLRDAASSIRMPPVDFGGRRVEIVTKPGIFVLIERCTLRFNAPVRP